MLGQRAVAVYGDPNDINCWSNTPYSFLQAGKRAGFLQLGLAAQPQKLKWQKLLWNLAAPLRGDRLGGFQYTQQANKALFQTVDVSAVSEIISHFQLFPPHEICQSRGISFSHYIDFPLPCLFEDYGIAKTIGVQTAKDALAREREQYSTARYVICMSHWAARQVVERCSISAHKVHTIIPGANLPESAFAKFQSDHSTHLSLSLEELPDGKKTPLRIAFVGKDPIRKGLDRLVTGVQILRQRKYKVIVRVIGPSKNLFPYTPEIEHIGFVNKLDDPSRLITELKNCHIGALLSYQEAFGIAALEYLRCGLPTLLTKTGGLGESIPTDCRIILPVNCTGADIADCLENLLNNPEQFQQLRSSARNQANYASWDRTIRDFQELWDKDKKVTN